MPPNCCEGACSDGKLLVIIGVYGGCAMRVWRERWLVLIASLAVATSLLGSVPPAQAAVSVSGATPTITGTAKVGKTLTAKPGKWKPADVALEYQWYRSGAAIEDATGASYTLTAADRGKTITVKVTGSKAEYDSLTKTSKKTKKVAAGTLTTRKPTITGTAKVGSELTANTGTWGPSGVSLSYQWYRSGKKIKGSIQLTYLLVAADKGKTITVKVTGAKPGYTTAAKTSKKTKKVTPNTLAASTPTVAGVLEVGETLSADPGSWTSGTKLAYQWLRNGSSISKATKATYKLIPIDADKKISVKVTGSLAGHITVSKTSLPTAVIGRALTTTPTPTIAGQATVGETLTANPGTWAPSPVTLTYQWLRDNVTISGATSSTYSVVAADAGARISVTVTGSKSGYATVSRSSSQTGAIAAKTFTSAPTPIVSGTPKVGATLTGSPGEWAPAPDDLTYQWHRAGDPISGATDLTYTLAISDTGAVITFTVTGSKNGYATVSRTSAPTTAVISNTFTTAPTPTVIGTVAVGRSLTAQPGTWTPTPGSLAYQWLRDNTPISGATSENYLLVAADLGTTVAVRVTATRTGHASVSRTSDPTSPVAAGVITAGTPTINGTATVGETLTILPGAWGPAAVDLSYEWLRDGTPIRGATTSTYILASDDAGKTITARVTGSKPGHSSVSRTSEGLAIGSAQSEAPTITAVAPASGTVSGGTVVVISGANLTGATGVSFGTLPGTNLQVLSDTQVEITTPPHNAGTVRVQLTTPAGTATTEYVYTIDDPDAVQHVSGALVQNTTWSADQIYVVDTNLTVNTGVTLTVQPGTILKFSANSALQVDGALVVSGTQAAPVVFTSLADDSAGGDTNGDGETTSPYAGQWSGIIVDAGGVANLDHVEIRYTATGVTGWSVSKALSVTNSRVEHGGGIDVTSSAAVTVSNNTVSDITYVHPFSSGQAAITVRTSAAVVVSGNVISRSHGPGIVVTQSGTPSNAAASTTTVTGNTVDGVTVGAGIYVNAAPRNAAGTSLANLPAPTVTNNTVSHVSDRWSPGWGHPNWVWNATSGIAVVVQAVNLLPARLTGNIGIENTVNAMQLGGVLKADLTLPVVGLPVIVGADTDSDTAQGLTIGSGVTLTLEAGTVVKFNPLRTVGSGWPIGLEVQGTLVTQGTQAAPVVFTSLADDSAGGDTNGDGETTSPYAGQWSGIIVSGGIADLDGVVLTYAATAVSVMNSGAARIRGSITASVVGVDATAGTYADATDVDWGDPSGPEPVGTGPKVSGAVSYFPWVGFEELPAAEPVSGPYVPYNSDEDEGPDWQCEDFVVFGMRESGAAPQWPGALSPQQIDALPPKEGFPDWQFGFGVTGWEVFKAFEAELARMAPDATVKAIGVRYEAKTLPLPGSGVSLEDYSRSILDGASKLRQYIREENAHCRGKHQRFLVIGYSQGALSTHYALNSLPAEDLQMLAGIALVGDAGRMPFSEETLWRGVDTDGQPILANGDFWLSGSASVASGISFRLPTFAARRTVSLCHVDDMMCARSLIPLHRTAFVEAWKAHRNPQNPDWEAGSGHGGYAKATQEMTALGSWLAATATSSLGAP